MRELPDYTREILGRVQQEKTRIRRRRKVLAVSLPILCVVLLGALSLPRLLPAIQTPSPAFPPSDAEKAAEPVDQVSAATAPQDVFTGGFLTLSVTVQEAEGAERSLPPEAAEALAGLLTELSPSSSYEGAPEPTLSEAQTDAPLRFTLLRESAAPAVYQLRAGLLYDESNHTTIPLSPGQEEALRALLATEASEERSKP